MSIPWSHMFLHPTIKTHSLKENNQKNQEQDNAKTVIKIIHSNIVFFSSQLPCVCTTGVKNVPDSLSSFLLPLTIWAQRSTKYLKLRATFKVSVYKGLLSDTPNTQAWRRRRSQQPSGFIFSSTHAWGMYGSGLSKGSQIPSLSLTPVPFPPCYKVRAAVSENGHFLLLSLCSETLPQFHLLDKQSKPKEQLSEEKKQQFPPLFFPPQCHQCFIHCQKA